MSEPLDLPNEIASALYWKAALDYQCNQLEASEIIREVMARTPSPVGTAPIEAARPEVEKLVEAAREYADAFREWHEDSELFPSDRMLEASTDILRALGLELVEDEEKGEWTLQPLPPSPASTTTNGDG